MTPPDKLADALRAIRDTARCEGLKLSAAWVASTADEALAAHAASLAAPPAQGEFLPADEQQPFAGIAGCRPLERAPQPAPAPLQVYVLSELADEIEATYPNADASNLRAFGAQPPTPGEAEFPALPNPWQCETRSCPALFSGEQMRNYAIAALAQQRVPDAVDLEQFREAVERYGDEMGVNASVNETIKSKPEIVQYWRRKEAEAVRLLALIDQQQEARGNGE